MQDRSLFACFVLHACGSVLCGKVHGMLHDFQDFSHFTFVIPYISLQMFTDTFSCLYFSHLSNDLSEIEQILFRHMYVAIHFLINASARFYCHVVLQYVCQTYVL